MNNLLSHSDGLEKTYQLRSVYELEIECVCLNSNFFDISSYLPKAQTMLNNYPDQVVLKESEDHSEECPYYELSVFCNNSDLEKFTKILTDLNFSIDLVHENKDMYSPYGKN